MIQPLVCQVSGYHIHDVSLVASLGIFIGLLPLVGFAVTRIKSVSAARLIAWGMTISSTRLVERLSTAEPSGTRMVLVIVALLFSMKLVVAIESRSRGDKPLPFWNWIAFTMFWFGMRTRLFAEFGNPLKDDWQTYIVRGFWRIGLGAALFGAAYLLSFNSTPSITNLTTWSMTLCLMLGLSFLVHFGLFNLLVGVWRRLGLNCTPLFRAPILSQNLTEFWGKRWNLAFSEMTALAVFRPLKTVFGESSLAKPIATSVAFLFSGLLHELAISVPVQSGYGLPMLYFLMHGFAMSIENWLDRAGVKILANQWVGRIWTWAWILIPLPLLFHRSFLEGCVWPLVFR